jgi:hypothetical protein
MVVQTSTPERADKPENMSDRPRGHHSRFASFDLVQHSRPQGALACKYEMTDDVAKTLL